MSKLTLALIAAGVVSAPAASLPDKVTYDDHVVPLFRNHCFNCHNADKKKADLDLSTFNGIQAGGGSGASVSAGDASGSLLWKVIAHQEEPFMPPKSPKMAEDELALIRKWIEGGLLENAGSKAMAPKKPKVDLGSFTPTAGRPEGPPPMPGEDLLLEPVIEAPRAGAVASIAASPWAPLIAVAGQKQVLLYHADTLELLGVLPFPEGFPYVLKFSRSGRLLLAGGGIGAKTGKVALYDVASGRRLTEIGEEYDAVLAADLSPDQSQVALGGSSKLIRIYSTATGELLHTIKKHTEWITALAYSPDGVLLASGDRNGGVHLWEAHTARPYSDLKAHTQAITDMAWRDDSNIIATTGEDGQVMLWGVENSNRIRNWAAHGGGSQSVRFSHDGRLVTTGRDRVTKLWDGNGGQQRAFEALRDMALTAAITHDMTRVLAADFSGEIRVWQAADGKLAGQLNANPPSIARRLEEDQRRLDAARVELQKTSAAESIALQSDQSARKDLESAKAEVARLQTAQAQAIQESAKLSQALEAMSKAKQETEAQLAAILSSREKEQAASQAAQLKATQIKETLKKTLQLADARQKELQSAEVNFQKAAQAAQQEPGNADLALAMEKASKERDSLRKTLEETKVQAQSLEAEVSKESTLAATLQTALTASLMKEKDTRLVLEKRISEWQATGKTIEAAKSKEASSMGSLKAATEKLPALEARVKDTTAALEKARALSTSSKSNVTQLEGRVHHWKVAQANVGVLQVTDRLSALEGAAQAAEAEAQAMEQAAQQALTQLTELRKELSGHQMAMQETTAKQAETQARLKEGTQELPGLQAALATPEKRIAELEAVLKQVQSEKAKAQGTWNTAKEGLAKLEAAHKAASEALPSLRTALEAAPDNASLIEAIQVTEASVKSQAELVATTRQATGLLEARVKDLTLKETQTTQALESEKQVAATARKAMVDHKALLAQWEQSLPTLEKQRTDLQARMKETTTRIQTTEAGLPAARETAMKARQKAQEASQALTPVREERARILQAFQALKGQS